MNQWIKTSESLPEMDVPVIVASDYGVNIKWRCDWLKPYAWTDNETPTWEAEEVTHWMPLPDLPE